MVYLPAQTAQIEHVKPDIQTAKLHAREHGQQSIQQQTITAGNV